MGPTVEDQFQDTYPRHIVAVSGIVTDERGRILLVKGDRCGWEPPGGQVELGEDLVEALKREVLEESSVEVEVLRLAGVYSNLGRPEQRLAEQVNFAFYCEWVGGEPRAGNECTEAGFFEANEAQRMVKAPQQSAKLEDAVVGELEVRYRAYRTYPYEVSREGLTEDGGR
jgi:8-oxo-dGTP diphosphatase